MSKERIKRDYEAFIKYINLHELPLALSRYLEDLAKGQLINENIIYRVVLMLCGQAVEEYISQHENIKSHIRLTYCAAWRPSEDDLVESVVFVSPVGVTDLAGFEKLFKLEEELYLKPLKSVATGQFEYIKATDRPYLMVIDKKCKSIQVLSRDEIGSSTKPAEKCDQAVCVSSEVLSHSQDGVLNKVNLELALVQKMGSAYQGVEATTGYPYSGFFFEHVGERLDTDYYKILYNDLYNYLRNLRASISLVNMVVLSQDLEDLIRMQAVVALNMLRIRNLRHSIANSLTNICGSIYKMIDESGRDALSDALKEKKLLTEPGQITKHAIFNHKQIQDELANENDRMEQIHSLVDSIDYIGQRISETKQDEQQPLLDNISSQSVEDVDFPEFVSKTMAEISRIIKERKLKNPKIEISNALNKVRTRSVVKLIIMNLLLNAANHSSEKTSMVVEGTVKKVDGVRVVTFVIVNEARKPISKMELISIMSGRRSRRSGQRGLFYSRFFTNYLRDGKLVVRLIENKFRAELSFKEES